MKVKEAIAFIFEKMEKELPFYLYYHSVEHVKDVMQSAESLANMEAVSQTDRQLLFTAVAYHDSGFISQINNHEDRGCEIAKECLPGFGFSEKDIAVICDMIMATKIPQSPKNKLEEIICDADLDYLGRDDFWSIGNLLYQELNYLGIIRTEEEWNKLQLRFLNSHRYFTESARKLRALRKETYLKEIDRIVQTYND